MKTALLSGMASVAILFSSAQADVSMAMDALKGARYSWMTDGLDMQGGGVTAAELSADAVIDNIKSGWKIQSHVLNTLKASLKDPVFRATAQEMAGFKSKDYLTSGMLVKHMAGNPIYSSEFNNYGVLTSQEEMVMGIESLKLGYIGQISNATDVRAATLKLWRQASSPVEERIKYSASARYGID